MEDLIKLDLVSIAPSNFGSNSFILLLKGFKLRDYVFPIIIGALEAQAISVYIEEIQSPRPLSHELMVSILSNTTLQLNHVVITNFKNGVFYSNLIFDKDGDSLYIDARPSDAIALAIKLNVSIYITFNLLTQICIPEEELEEEEAQVPDVESINLLPSIEDLQSELSEAIKNEDYERAVKLRDQINKL